MIIVCSLLIKTRKMVIPHTKVTHRYASNRHMIVFPLLAETRRLDVTHAILPPRYVLNGRIILCPISPRQEGWLLHIQYYHAGAY